MRRINLIHFMLLLLMIAQSNSTRAEDNQENINSLIKSLDDENAIVRKRAAIALGKYGVKAKGAISSLEKRLNDPDKAVRDATAIALDFIEPVGSKNPVATSVKVAGQEGKATNVVTPKIQSNDQASKVEQLLKDEMQISGPEKSNVSIDFKVVGKIKKGLSCVDTRDCPVDVQDAYRHYLEVWVAYDGCLNEGGTLGDFGMALLTRNHSTYERMERKNALKEKIFKNYDELLAVSKRHGAKPPVPPK